MANTNKPDPKDVRNGSIVLILMLCSFVGCSIYQSSQVSKEEPESQRVDNWYPRESHIACEYALEQKLRDPDSYRRDGDFISRSESGSKKVVAWRFRAKNGFGGYEFSTAICNVSKENGGTVSVSIASN